MLAFASDARLGVLGSVAVGDRYAEQASAHNCDTADEEGTALHAFAFYRCCCAIGCRGVGHQTAPSWALAACPVAAWIALRMRG